ncbi:MAG: PAS domain S-box protein [Pseudohongiella sp.]|nr:PAS domain S-box protein [Pseudohongiella sp.]
MNELIAPTMALPSDILSDHFMVAPQMMCICAFDGTFIRVNPAMCDTLGYEESQLCGELCVNWMHQDDLIESRRLLRSLSEGKSLTRIQNRFLCKDGTYRFFEWSARASSEYKLVYAVVDDITEKWQSQKAVKESNILLSAVSQSLSEFIGSEGATSPFETMLANLLRITDSEYGFIGEVLHGENGEPYLRSHALTNIAWDEPTRKFYDENMRSGMEFRNLNTLFGHVMTSGHAVISNNPGLDLRSGGLPPGHPPLNAFMGLPIYSGSELIGMVGVANRPTGYDSQIVEYLELLLAACANLILAFRAERSRSVMQERLVSSERTIRTVVDSAADGILTLNQDGIILAVNPAIEEMFEYSASGIIGGSSTILFHRKSGFGLKRFLALSSVHRSKSASSVRGRRKEMLGIKRSGKVFPVEATVSAMELGDQVHFVVIVRDVTDWTQVRSELQQARALAEAANKAKGEFLANMSHEVRTPINGVIGMLELALGTELTSEQRDYIGTAHESAQALLRIVNDILDFSRIDAGRLELDSAPLDLRRILTLMMREFSVQAHRKGLKLRFEIEDDVPIVLEGDAIRLRQVIVNLVSNSLKFTESGEVHINIRRIGGDQFSALLSFAVCDTGIGIADKKQKEIFNAFYQGDSTITRKYGGSGLGLVISSNLVKLMGGEIRLKSRQGIGSEFSFDLTFPIVEVVNSEIVDEYSLGTVTVQISDESAAKNSVGGSILLAEDNLINQKLAKAVLQKAGYAVTVAENGLEAVEWIKKQHFDVVLMDLQMPEMDGMAATQVIRALERTNGRHTPIIALTAHAMSGDRDRCLEGGMDAYISKPIAASALLSLVRSFSDKCS